MVKVENDRNNGDDKQCWRDDAREMVMEWR